MLQISWYKIFVVSSIRVVDLRPGKQPVYGLSTACQPWEILGDLQAPAILPDLASKPNCGCLTVLLVHNSGTIWCRYGALMGRPYWIDSFAQALLEVKSFRLSPSQHSLSNTQQDDWHANWIICKMKMLELWKCWSIIQLTAANRCIGRLLSRLSVDTLSSYSLNKLDREQLDEPKELESRLRSWRIWLNFKLNSVSVLSTASVPLNQHYWFSYTCQQVAITDCKKLAKFILPQLEHERSVPDVAAIVYISIYCNMVQ